MSLHPFTRQEIRGVRQGRSFTSGFTATSSQSSVRRPSGIEQDAARSRANEVERFSEMKPSSRCLLDTPRMFRIAAALRGLRISEGGVRR